jgi:hypothetical protein
MPEKRLSDLEYKRIAFMASFFINDDVLFSFAIEMGSDSGRLSVACADVDKWLALDEINLEKP